MARGRFCAVFGIRWRVLRALQIAIGVVVTAYGASLSAAEIRWFGEGSCRRELEVASQVETMTGQPVSAIDRADFELNLQSPSQNEWSLELVTLWRADGARSSRIIRGNACVEVTDAAAVAIALAVGPGESSAVPRPEPPKAAHEAKEAVPYQSPPPARRRSPNASRALDWLVGLSVALDSSATPSVAPGAGLRVGLTWQPSYASDARLRFELAGALYAPTETSDVGGRAGKFQLGYLAPLVCAALPSRGTTLLACAGYELGQLSGEGIGSAVTASHPRGTFWSAARAELGLLVPLAGALRFSGRAGAALPLVRREFVIDGPDVVFRPALLSARVEIGVELTL